jgi:hypothetical protein
MKQVFIIIVLLIYSLGWAEDTASRYSVELPDTFAMKNLRVGESLTYKALGGKWNGDDFIVAFAKREFTISAGSHSQPIGSVEIIGRVYILDSSGLRKEYLIDTIREEGGEPKIEGVGFLNADADPENELIIITSWEQRHYDVSGILYDVFVYDNILDISTNRLVYKRNISEQFAPECECKWIDGRRGKAKFKTLSDVEKELKRLKFRQFYKSNYE